MLGGVEVTGADGPLALGPTARVLLAALLVARHEVVGLDSLTEALWRDDPPATARATLQTHLSKLRRVVQEVPGASLELRSPGYVLDADRASIDADRFEDLVAAGRALAAHRPRPRRRRTSAGPGVLARRRAGRVRRGALGPARGRPPHRAAPGRPKRSGSTCSSTPAGTPSWCPSSRPSSAPTRSASGSGASSWSPCTAPAGRPRPCAARRSCGVTSASSSASSRRPRSASSRRRSPSTTPASTADRPRAHEPRPGSRPRAGARGAHRRHPPRRPGRRRRPSARRARRRPPLLTLVGPGGVGKTRLAFELAGTVDRRPRRPGPCGGAGGGHPRRTTSPPPSPPPSAVERRPGRSLEESIVELLAPQRALVVVDNCEHVLGAVGRLVGEVLRWCPGVRVLATSREALGMPGEVVWSVGPLELPTDPGASVESLRTQPRGRRSS